MKRKQVKKIAAGIILTAVVLSGCGSATETAETAEVTSEVSESISEAEQTADQEITEGKSAVESAAESAVAETEPAEAESEEIESVSEVTESAEETAADMETEADTFTEAEAEGENTEAADAIDEDGAASTVEVTEEQKTVPAIGEAAEGDRVISVLFVNETGQDIVSFRMKDIYAGDYSENMLAEEDPFLAGEERMFYYDAAEDKEGTQYNLKLSLADGTVKSITAAPFEDMTSGAIRYEDGTMYIAYTSVKSGEEKDTRGAEKAYRDSAKAAKEAAAYEEEDSGAPAAAPSSGNSNECIGSNGLMW